MEIRHGLVNATELVSDLVGLYEPAFADRRQRVEMQLPGPVIVGLDASLIGRTLSNLLDNALIHAKPRATAHVRVAADAERVILTVEDDGPEFAPELLGRPLSCGHSTRRRTR